MRRKGQTERESEREREGEREGERGDERERKGEREGEREEEKECLGEEKVRERARKTSVLKQRTPYPPPPPSLNPPPSFPLLSPHPRHSPALASATMAEALVSAERSSDIPLLAFIWRGAGER